MNKNLAALYATGQKDTRRIIGLMSGTSLDGLDIAVCDASGFGHNTRVRVLAFGTTPYKSDFRKRLLAVCFKDMVDFKEITTINKEIAVLHASMILEFLRMQKIETTSIDLIGSHGQTFYHAPGSDEHHNHSTLQLGDGDQIAVLTGIPTVSDFRQKHIASGGEGAPLAGYGDLLLFGDTGNNIVLINIGGISNVTYIPTHGDIVCSDIGPGNTLIDLYCKKLFAKDFDDNGTIAARGNVKSDLLQRLMSDSFFTREFPKSTGPEYFNQSFVKLRLGDNDVAPEDLIASLTELTSETIASAVQKVTASAAVKICVSGGGKKNKTIMQSLREKLPGAQFFDTEEKGIDADAKEAILFALLANETVAGDPAIFATRGLRGISMGKISFPG